MPARIVRMHRLAPLRTDEQLQDEFDDLMILACNGDRRALGAIAIALTPTLLEEARAELGCLEKHAADVLAEALTTISEGAGGFDPTRERATVWMKRFVREIAREHRARLTASRSSGPDRAAPARRARARHALRSPRRRGGRPRVLF
jgi:hypothetical protein